jgi:hypothetical protein
MTATVASLKVSTVEGGLDTISLVRDRVQVGAFVRVPRGQSVTVTMVYEVPMSSSHDYQLYLQKEAGAVSMPVDLALSYPGGVSRRGLQLATDQTVRQSW